MSIDELKSKIEELKDCEESLSNALFYIEQAEGVIPAHITFSHHAEMELQENLAQVQEALQDIKDKLAHLGVEV